jgi:hypothetical protein
MEWKGMKETLHTKFLFSYEGGMDEFVFAFIMRRRRGCEGI